MIPYSVINIKQCQFIHKLEYPVDRREKFYFILLSHTYDDKVQFYFSVNFCIMCKALVAQWFEVS